MFHDQREPEGEAGQPGGGGGAGRLRQVVARRVHAGRTHQTRGLCADEGRLCV